MFVVWNLDITLPAEGVVPGHKMVDWAEMPQITTKEKEKVSGSRFYLYLQPRWFIRDHSGGIWDRELKFGIPEQLDQS